MIEMNYSNIRDRHFFFCPSSSSLTAFRLICLTLKIARNKTYLYERHYCQQYVPYEHCQYVSFRTHTQIDYD